MFSGVSLNDDGWIWYLFGLYVNKYWITNKNRNGPPSNRRSSSHRISMRIRPNRIFNELASIILKSRHTPLRWCKRDTYNHDYANQWRKRENRNWTNESVRHVSTCHLIVLFRLKWNWKWNFCRKCERSVQSIEATK